MPLVGLYWLVEGRLTLAVKVWGHGGWIISTCKPEADPAMQTVLRVHTASYPRTGACHAFTQSHCRHVTSSADPNMEEHCMTLTCRLGQRELRIDVRNAQTICTVLSSGTHCNRLCSSSVHEQGPSIPQGVDNTLLAMQAPKQSTGFHLGGAIRPRLKPVVQSCACDGDARTSGMLTASRQFVL